ncbi:hypothetical protein HHL28_13720 [Aerophototrophica crusticola]|uniref:Yip1 domain-containing protein n=1 Tax=Aerophototrophica crusticola TaxID=1709002 RepID=A0A858R958_9PROT|nr:hypothetical protein HHL28_13720 [Rhodospirillaceae bacterium B3]
MSFARDAAYGLHAALRFARFDASGAASLDPSAGAAWRSFQALWVVLPAYLVLASLVRTPEEQAAGLLPFLLLTSIAFVAKLAGILLLIWQVMAMQGDDSRMPAFITAGNWSSVVQVGVLVLTVGLSGLVGLPVPMQQVIGLVASVWALAYGWFVTRTSLAVSGLAAAGFVLLDLFVGAIVDSVARGMLPMGTVAAG